MRRLAVSLLAWTTAPLAIAAAAAGPASAAVAAAPASAVRHHAQPPSTASRALDERIRLMTRELDLDERQQGELRNILEAHRVQVAKAWSDPSVPAAVRVQATQDLSDRMAEQIRAMLTDAQREKYLKPRQRDAAVGAGPVDVQALMRATGKPAGTEK